MSKAWPIIVKITGPGGNINYEAEVVIRALKAEGINVEVENAVPIGNTGTYKDADEMFAHCRRLIKEGHEDYVKVIVDHQPWGG